MSNNSNSNFSKSEYTSPNYPKPDVSDSKYSTPNYAKNNFAAQGESARAFKSKRAALATPQCRLIAFVLDGALISITLGVGWIIWFIAIADRGTTPGYDLMGQTIVDHKTGKPLKLGKMLVRELLVKGVLAWIIASFTMFINYIVDGVFIFREDRRSVHDLIMGTDVVQDRSSAILEKLQSL